MDPTWGILTSRSTELASANDALFLPDKHRPKRKPKVLELFISNGGDQTCGIHVREPLRHGDIVDPRSHHTITYPLMTRAWTLQERLLSRCTLHFTAFELIWECKTTLFCEYGSISREFMGLHGNHSPKIGYERAMAEATMESSSDYAKSEAHYPQARATMTSWTLTIGGYSTRRLTYVSDKLPAISGLARKFRMRSRTYLAGLWLEDLPWLMCWRAYSERVEQRTAVYCAPTWSWASLTSPVIWYPKIYTTQ